jgi:hypothetical protein
MKLNTIMTDAIRGFATVATVSDGIEAVIWHENMAGLQSAYERVTGLPFHPALSQPTALFNLNHKPKK